MTAALLYFYISVVLDISFVIFCHTDLSNIFCYEVMMSIDCHWTVKIWTIEAREPCL